jgi:glycosyltransferase involved in cell wall biosynthesis
MGDALPNHVVPHAIVPEPQNNAVKKDVFRVLVVADSRSSLERKNVAAAIRAFEKFAGPNENIELVLKLSALSDETYQYLNLSKTASKTRLITSRLSQKEMSDLYRSADVLLSLHRAEGFGLHMLEAMACGKPVVATNWSGNLDFMSTDNSVLIDAKMLPVQDPFVYRSFKHAFWADANVDQAAEALRALFLQPSFASRLGNAARKRVAEIAENWRIPEHPASLVQDASLPGSEMERSRIR